MLQNSNLTIGTAVANQSGAIESRYHFKNGASLKSRMSRRNLLKNAILFFIVICFAESLQAHTFVFDGTIETTNNQQDKSAYGYVDLKTDSLLIIWGDIGKNPNFIAVSKQQNFNRN